MSDAAKKAFGGNFDAFFEDLEGMEVATQVFKDVEADLQKYKINQDTIDKLLDGVNTEFAKGLGAQAEKIGQSLTGQGKSEEEINNTINGIFSDLNTVLNESQIPATMQEQLKAQFAGLDLTNADQLQKF
jgi:hypothetical protein